MIDSSLPPVHTRVLPTSVLAVVPYFDDPVALRFNFSGRVSSFKSEGPELRLVFTT